MSEAARPAFLDDPVSAFLAFWRSLSADRAFRVLFVAFLALHLWKVARLLPVPLVADGAPLVEYHYSQIYVDVVHDRAFRETSKRSWGYDPYTGGGHVVGAGLIPESHAVIAFDRLIRPFARPDTSIKIFTALALAAGPLLLFAAARLFALSRGAALASAALFSAGMIGHDAASTILVYRGHITFWLACLVAPLNASAQYAWGLRRTPRLAVLWIATWPLLLLLDPAVAVVQLVPALAIALGRAQGRLRALLWLEGALIVALAANAFWLAPYVKFNFNLLDMSEWPSGGLQSLTPLFLPVPGPIVERLQAAMRGSLFLMSIGGLLALPRERRRLTAVIALWAAALAAVGLFGSQMPFFHDLDPGRLVFGATTVLLLPVGVYVTEHVFVPGSRRIVFAAWFLWFLMTWQLVHPFEGHPLRNALTPREQRLLVDLRALPPSGRILVQYNPLFTDGLRLATVEKLHAFAGFTGSWWKSRDDSAASFGLFLGQWYLFGAPLKSYDQKKVEAALAVYDVAYVVTTAPVGHAFFSYFSGFEEVPSQGEGAYRIFRVTARPPGFLPAGGKLAFDYDRFQIHDAPAGRLVLSFHAADGFYTVPPLAVHAVENRAGGPALLAIDNPLGRKEIEVRYGGN